MRHQSGDDIGVFLEVCEAGSFIAAAIRLALSPSAVAKAVARIEGRLQVRLFQRTTRRLNLTAEGRMYQTVCRRARADMERAEATILSLAHEPSGPLHVTLPPLFGARIIAPILYDLCRHYRGLELNISTSTETLDLLARGIDLAIRIGELPDSTGLTARRLGVQRIVLCGSKAYFEDRAVPRDLDDLGGHQLIGAPRGGRAVPWSLRDADGKIVTLVPKARLLLEGSQLTLSAVKDGHGLGLLPQWLVRQELKSGQLVSVLEDRIAGHLPVHVIWPTSAVVLPRLRVAIDAIVDVTRPLLLEQGAP